MTDDTETPAPLGHNNPPPEAPKTIQERLAADHAVMVARIAELKKLADAAPEEVLDEDTFKPLSDLLKAGRVALSASEAARKIENEESRRTTAMIDAWFKNPAEELAKALKEVKGRTDAYLEEKRVKEEKRRKAEADAKAALAREKAEDALWADARGELAAYDARKAEELAKIERARKEASARRADHLKNRSKRLGAVEPYLAERAERRRIADEKVAEANRQAAADEEARQEADRQAEARRQETARKAQEDADRLRLAQETTAAELKDAKTETAAARRAETKATGQADTLFDQADEHVEQAEDLGGEADRLGKKAARAEKHANAGPAAMSRTRSEMGTVSSETRAWKVIDINRDELDLNELRGYLHPDAVAVAVRGYMMAHRTDVGGPKLKGAVFDQVEEGVYR